MTIPEAALTAFVGLVSGAIGSLIAPWINWGIEKKRLTRQARKELLELAYKQITDEVPRKEFSHGALFARLRPHLSEDVRRAIEDSRTTIVTSSGKSKVDPYVEKLHADLHRLEVEWGMI